MCWRWVKARWLNNAQTQRHMQSTPVLYENLGESTCTRKRNHDEKIYRLLSAFDCRLNVVGWNPLGYTFNHSFCVLSWKVLWTSGKLHLSVSATKTTITNFLKESKCLKQPENISKESQYQSLSKYFPSMLYSIPVYSQESKESKEW